MRLWFLLCLFFIGIHIAAAQDETTLDITEFTLDNGLEVILVEDASAPTAAISLWYQVGGANDPEGRSGFAHLFEHMMFEGSAHVANGEFDTLLTRVGGQNNAYTDTEITGYYEVIPSNQLPLALWLEADRMASLDVSQTNLDNQRAVVIEEYQFRVANAPYGEAFQDLFTMPYDYQPYQKWVIGSVEDLNRASLEDVRRFHDTYYRPNNATLVVAGDIDVEQTRELIEDLFGDIPAGDEPPALPPYQPTQRDSAESVTIEDGLIDVPAYLVGYTAPARNHPDFPALELLSRILGSGASSRLAQAMIDTGLAADAGAALAGNRGPSLFYAYAFPNTDVELDTLEQIYSDQIRRFIEGDIQQEELEKVINQIRSERIAGLETALDLAESVQAANYYFDNPQAVFGEIERFEQVTVEDIQRVAEEYLAPEDAYIIRVVPGEVTTTVQPAPVVGAEDDAAAEATPEFVLEQTTPPEPFPVSEFALPEITENVLENGLELVVIERPELPLLSVDLYLPGGGSAVPADKAGLAEITASLLTRGTETRSAQEIASVIEQEGGSIGAGASSDSLSVGVFALKEDIDLAFDLLSDVALNPTFPEAEFEIEREGLLTGLQFELDDPEALGYRVFNQLIYGEHPYGNLISEESLADLSRADVVEFYQSQLNPDGALLIVAGDVTTEEALEYAEETFGQWEAEGERQAVTYPELSSPDETTIYLVDRPGSTQAQFIIGQAGLVGNDPERFGAQVMNRILGGDFNARLSLDLREEKGYTYGIYSSFNFPADRGTFDISTAVRNEVAGPALEAILNQINRIRNEEVPVDELADVKSSLIGGYALGLETYQAFINQVASLKLRGLPLETLSQYIQNIEPIDEARVLEAAQQYLNPEQFVIVVVGDASAIQDDLEAIAPVEIIEAE
jgi:zinc protease